MPDAIRHAYGSLGESPRPLRPRFPARGEREHLHDPARCPEGKPRRAKGILRQGIPRRHLGTGRPPLPARICHSRWSSSPSSRNRVCLQTRSENKPTSVGGALRPDFAGQAGVKSGLKAPPTRSEATPLVQAARAITGASLVHPVRAEQEMSELFSRLRALRAEIAPDPPQVVAQVGRGLLLDHRPTAASSGFGLRPGKVTIRAPRAAWADGKNAPATAPRNAGGNAVSTPPASISRRRGPPS